LPTPSLLTDVRERTDAERPADDGGGGGLSRSRGFGDFGGVDPEPAPTLVQRAGTTKFNYDGEMRLNDVEDALGHHTTVTYDPVGRVTQVKRPLEISTSRYVTHDFGHDLNGNHVQTTRPASWLQLADLNAYAAFRKVHPPAGGRGGVVPERMWDFLGGARFTVVRNTARYGGPPAIVP
jgi:YD repeat-containing protein